MGASDRSWLMEGASLSVVLVPAQSNARRLAANACWAAYARMADQRERRDASTALRGLAFVWARRRRKVVAQVWLFLFHRLVLQNHHKNGMPSEVRGGRCPNKILAYQVPHPICHPTTHRGSERQIVFKFLHGRWHTDGRCETHGGSNGWGRSPPAAQHVMVTVPHTTPKHPRTRHTHTHTQFPSESRLRSARENYCTQTSALQTPLYNFFFLRAPRLIIDRLKP